LGALVYYAALYCEGDRSEATQEVNEPLFVAAARFDNQTRRCSMSDDKNTSISFEEAMADLMSRFDLDNNERDREVLRIVSGEWAQRAAKTAVEGFLKDLVKKPGTVRPAEHLPGIAGIAEDMMLIALPLPVPGELGLACMVYCAWHEAGQPTQSSTGGESEKQWMMEWLAANPYHLSLTPTGVERVATVANPERGGGRTTLPTTDA
jgi:hypothetical protein